MGDVLYPQSFGLCPPTGGYDSSDLLRRSQTTCIREIGLLEGRTLDVGSLVRPTRGRSMGDVLYPQSFGLRPPTGGYDSSDLLRRSQTTCIREIGLLEGRTLDVGSLVRPTRGRSMGDVLYPQSFGLRPPTGGYDSSDLLRRSQTTCIHNVDPSYYLRRRSQTMCIRNVYPSYHLLRRSRTTCICEKDPSYHLLRRSQ